MKLNEYQELAMRTNNKDASLTDQLHNAGHGISGEVGEVIVELIKEPVDPRALSKELGDVTWYLAQLADALAFNLEDTVSGKESLEAYMRDMHPHVLFDFDFDSLMMLNLAVSAGRINELLKKMLHHDKKIVTTSFYEPIKSILRCLSSIASELCGTTLEGVLQGNIDKLKERWPDGFKVTPAPGRCTADHDHRQFKCIAPKSVR